MKKVKKIYKYGTGQEIPKGAVYLCTKVERGMRGSHGMWVRCWLVWHYFLVEVEKE